MLEISQTACIRVASSAALWTSVFTSTSALAGGFAVPGQSTVFLGTSLGGAAAGSTLSSMFWNSAATAELSGVNFEASFAYLITDTEVTVESTHTSGVATALFNPIFAQADPHSGDIVPDAIVPAMYGSYQVSEQLYLGLGINGPFGLKTEPAERYMGSPLGRATKLFTSNANPTIAFRFAPGVTIGAGAQIEYAVATLKFASGTPLGDSTVFDAADWAFGGTAGVMLKPFAGTSIGLGWRSQLTHTFRGNLNRHATGSLPVPGLPIALPPIPASSIGAEGDLDLPDVVTLSFRQEIASNMRVMGTVEWTNWSRFEKVELRATEDGINPVTDLPVSSGDVVSTIDANWADGWHFGFGGEYDWNANLTLRGGLAYVISPIDDPSKRLTTVPDADQFWLSLGASYDYSEATTIDVAYVHVFVEDSRFERTTLGNPAIAITSITGRVEGQNDTISIGLRSKF